MRHKRDQTFKTGLETFGIVPVSINNGMKKIRQVVLCTLLFLTWGQGNCRQLLFSGYSIAEGLSQSVVTSVFQDSLGYIWFGTQNGLNKFNGYTFEVFTYKPHDTTSIPNNWIYGITEDRNGNLWIGTKGGLCRYDRKNNRFGRIRYTTPYSIDITEYVYDVKCARNGNILINTPPVLTVCTPETMVFTHHFSPLSYDGSVKDYNIPLMEDAKGRIWTGSTRGLACYLPEEGGFKTYNRDTMNRLTISDDHITALYEDGQGSIWVGTRAGLNRFDEAGGSFIPIEKSGADSFSGPTFIRALSGDDSGNLWIATEGNGLIRMNKEGAGAPIFETFTTTNSPLNHNIILSLATDRSKNLWIGTLSGINKTDLKKQKFRLYRKEDSPHSVDLAGNVVASLYKDEEGAVWVGNWGQGLNIYDRNTGMVDHYSSHRNDNHFIPDDYVHAIFEDSENTVWIGTRDGLLVFDKQNRRFIRPGLVSQYHGFPGLSGLRIFMMIQGRNGDYWIATQDGLYRKKTDVSGVERFHTLGSSGYTISANQVYGVIEDKEGLIWIATTEGLDCFNPQTPAMIHFRKTEGKSNSLADNFITSLCEDHKGNLWIGTSSYVNKFSKKDSSFTYYSKEQGLPGNIIYSILEDKNCGLWFATGNGLCRFDSISSTFHTYSVEDGLQSPEFNLGASFLGKDGEVFFGGMNGFNSFYPDSLENNPYIPEIAFTSIYKMRDGVKEYLHPGENNRIELAHNDRSFTVEFAALEFTNPSKNLYMYRLKGIDDDWISIGHRNFVPFTNLRPGEYRLRVRGTNNDGLWNEEGALLTLRIRPPWWGSHLAYIVYSLSVIAVAGLIIRKREKNLVRERKMLEEKVKERTLLIEEQKVEIMQKNSELREAVATKDKFFSIIAHDLRNPFNFIQGFTDLLLMDLQDTSMGKMKKSLENIRDSSQQAYELLENLLLWARSQTGTLLFMPEPADLHALVMENIRLSSIQAVRKNITLNSQLESCGFVSVDVNMVRTILRNLLTNALKFTPHGGEIWIKLSLGEGFFRLSVKDNGRGIPADRIDRLFSTGIAQKERGTHQESGTGLGLILCREFAERHGGRIEVASKEGEGSEFTVIIPLNNP